MAVYRDEFSKELPDFGYLPSLSGYLAEVKEQVPKFMKVDVPVTGDIVLMKIKTAPIHTGLFVAPGYILHSYNENHGVVLDRLHYWQNQIEGYYRWMA